MFVTNKTILFFKSFNLKTTFFDGDSAEFNENEDYNNATEKVSKIRVLNDTTERSVQLMQSYNRSRQLTKNKNRRYMFTGNIQISKKIPGEH